MVLILKIKSHFLFSPSTLVYETSFISIKLQSTFSLNKNNGSLGVMEREI
jgi:hypothetical protein